MTETMIDRVARALHEAHKPWCDYTHPFEDPRSGREVYEALARAAIAALREPTEGMWGGLARDLMMAFDMNPNQPTPRAIFTHLKRTGRPTPQWLRDEPEMTSPDHVPSKGTRATIIYKAMIDAALKETPDA